jgi:hypothetical protein
VGEGGTVVRLEEGRWQTLSTFNSARLDLRGVWCESESSAFVVGSTALSLYHLSGDHAEPLVELEPSGGGWARGPFFDGIWGTGSCDLVVVSGDTAYHLSGALAP